MAKIISLFNHKGGVSKTTTVFHLGWMLANLGKKVLIIDADPQCNLTGLTLGVEDYDSLFKFYDSKQNTDIFNSLAPLFSVDSSFLPIRTDAITSTRNKNLKILAGNIKFSELDIQIATAMTSSTALPILKKFVGAFRHLVNKLTTAHDFDFVLVDMSPSVSATNQTIVMSSDYFIIPVSPDFYCYQAIDSLSNVLPKWSDDLENFKGNDEFSLPKKNPKMLGFISQNYRVYTSEDSEQNEQRTMAKAYMDWLEKIRSLANHQLVPALSKKQMIISPELFEKYVSHDRPYHLASIPNFNSMIPISQKQSKPLFELTEADGKWTGGRWLWHDKKSGREYGVKVNIEEAKSIFTNLSEAIINITENDR